MRACVIDDEPLAAQLIESYIRKTPFLTFVGAYFSAQEAVKVVMDGEVDLVFLDIRMPQLNGLEFARIIPKGTQVVFTTAYDSHAIEAFRVGAADYLLKPVSYEEFTAATLRAKERWEMQRLLEKRTRPAADGKLLLKINHRMEQIDTRRILYVEGLKDYVKIYLEPDTPDAPLRPLVTLASMRSLESHLPESDFLRVHRSFIVNTAHIANIERTRLTVHGQAIPVGESYRQALSDYIATHSPND